mgnify:CR=1 FL=1
MCVGDETWAFLNWPPFSHHFLDGLWGCGRLLTEATEREQEQLFTQIIGIIKDQPQESSKEFCVSLFLSPGEGKDCFYHLTPLTFRHCCRLSVHTGCAILFLRILSMNFRLRDHNMLNKLRVFPLVRKLMSRRSQILETQLVCASIATIGVSHCYSGRTSRAWFCIVSELLSGTLVYVCICGHIFWWWLFMLSGVWGFSFCCGTCPNFVLMFIERFFDRVNVHMFARVCVHPVCRVNPQHLHRSSLWWRDIPPSQRKC